MRILIHCICTTVYLLLSVEAQAISANDSMSMDKIPTAVAFINVNVVPMDRERVLPGQTVIVRGDRISEVGPADTTDIPEGALRIDGCDKYLMPGLVDMHVHIWQDYQRTLFIANGVTAIRNMWGEDYHLKLREEIKAGKVIGPTLYTTGPLIDGSPPSWPTSTVVETPEQAARVVAEHKKAGYDFIKVYNRMSLECYDAIVKAAAKHKIPVVGHVPVAVGLEHSLALNQYSIEHLGGYGGFLQAEDSSSWRQLDETKIAHIVQATRDARTWNCVTLVVYEKTYGTSSEMAEQELERAYMKYVPYNKKAWWREGGSEEQDHSLRMSNRKRVTKALQDGGARILLGTDTQNPYVVAGFSLHQELQNLFDAGLTPYEAIRAGTRDAAECLGEQEEFGTISAGLRADLILLEDNPLEDVGNAANRIGVMARGRWFPQSELQSMLDTLAVKHATEENPDGVVLRGRGHSRGELEAMVDFYEETLGARNTKQREELIQAVLSSDRIFVKSSTWRGRLLPVHLAQLGLDAHLVEDPTTTRIEKGDLLIMILRGSDRMWTTIYDMASDAKRSGASVALLTGLVPSARLRDVSDLILVLQPRFDEAIEGIIGELVTAATVSIRHGDPVGKISYDDASATYTLLGGGNALHSVSDQFHFAHKELNDDGSITARIDSIQRVHRYTVAGVMIRDTTASDSAFAAAFVTADNGVYMQYRLKAGQKPYIIVARDATTLPRWIKLIREGDTFKAQHSGDGKNWNDLKWRGADRAIEIEMGAPVHVGLAVCSRGAPATTAEAKISQVSLGGDWSSSGEFTRSEDIGYEASDKPEEKATIPPDE